MNRRAAVGVDAQEIPRRQPLHLQPNLEVEFSGVSDVGGGGPLAACPKYPQICPKYAKIRPNFPEFQSEFRTDARAHRGAAAAAAAELIRISVELVSS